MNPAGWRRAMVGLFGLALAVRLTYLGEMSATPFFTVPIGDAKGYDAWARRIASGDWLGREVFYQTPLYPYLLGVTFSIFGHALAAVRLMQAALGALSCVLLATAGRRFFDERSGLVAGLLLAFYPPALFFDGLIQKAALDLFFMTSLVALVGSLQSRFDWRRLAALGVVLGLFTLNRENARALYPVLVVWLLTFDRAASLTERGRRAALLTVSMLLTALPVGLRNYQVGGEFLISTSQMGPNFYIGNHKGARGSYEELVPGHGDASHERSDAKALAEGAMKRTLSAREVSDYWMNLGLAYVRDQPLDWLRLLGRKALLTVGANEITDTESLEAYRQNSWVLRSLSWIHFGVIVPLAVFGLWLTRADWRRLGVLYAMCAATAAAVALFFVVARYRYPMVPLVLLFAAVPLSRLPGMMRASSPRAWVGALLGVALAFIVNRTPIVTEDPTYRSIGSELIRLGRPAEAIRLLEKAVRASPESAAAHLDLAIAFQQTGDTSHAIDEFTLAISLRPDYFKARHGLALTLQEAHRASEAIEHFQAAVSLRPDSSEARTDLGSALASLGRGPEAVREYEEVLRLNPGSAKANYNLAVALQDQGRVDDAIPHYLAAVEADPSDAEAHGNLALAFEAKGDADSASGTCAKLFASAPLRARSTLISEIF